MQQYKRQRNETVTSENIYSTKEGNTGVTEKQEKKHKTYSKQIEKYQA